MIPLPTIFSIPPFVLEGTARHVLNADSAGPVMGLWVRNNFSDWLD